MFNAAPLQIMTEYEIFQKTLFFTLAQSMNFGLNAVPVAAGQYL